MTIFKHMTPKSLLLAATMLATPLAATAPIPAAAQISISVQLEPPVLPVYEQPPIPAPGYLWTPGYWAYDNDEGYYWVPGTWVQPPQANVLWTPPYWGWADGAYVFHDGYWADHVGFYGGIDYGFGYGGLGYEGGRWDGGNFTYNRTVNNFGDVHITNVYETKVTVINDTHVSFNGGANGVKVQPTPAELAVAHEHHVERTSIQAQHMTAAAKNPELAAKQNGGHPQIAATARPGEFRGAGVVAAHDAPAGKPGEHVPQTAARPAEHPAPAMRPEEHPAPGREPIARPEEHPAPAARPEERPAPARPDEHPAPAARPEERPAPGREPAARPEEHAAPAARPEPHPAAPAARPEEHPAPAHEAPAARPPEHPPAAAHPAPAPHPEEKKPEDH